MRNIINIFNLLLVSFPVHAGNIIEHDIIVSDTDSHRVTISERYGDNASPIKVEIFDKKSKKLTGIHENICDLGYPHLCKGTKAYWNIDNNILVLSYLYPKIPATHFYSVNKKSYKIDKTSVFEKLQEHISIKEYDRGSHIEFVKWITSNKLKVKVIASKFESFIVFDAILEIKNNGNIKEIIVTSLQKSK